MEKTKTDGASTIVFGTWACNHNAVLYSIDHDSAAIAFSQKEVLKLELEDHVNFVNAESIAYLSNFEQGVDFMYLDSYDYDKRDKEIQRLSQEHHLQEFRAVEKRMHEDTLILIDDCRLPGGGKGRLLIDYMLSKEWKIIVSAYQVLLGKRV